MCLRSSSTSILTQAIDRCSLKILFELLDACMERFLITSKASMALAFQAKDSLPLFRTKVRSRGSTITTKISYLEEQGRITEWG
jgi:hypothetical protein